MLVKLNAMTELVTAQQKSKITVEPRRENPFDSLPDWVPSAVAIFVATVIFYFIVNESRSNQLDFSFGLLFGNELSNPYSFGVPFQDVIPILGLLILATSRPIFQRWVMGERLIGDGPKFFALFAGMELASLVYYEYISSETLTMGLLVIAIAGLLGGWRIGVGVGIISTFMRGLLHLFFQVGQDGDLYLITDALFWDLLEWFYLSVVPTLAPVWVGFVAGHIGRLLGPHRYSPGLVFLTGFPLHLCPSIFAYLVWSDPYRLETIPAVVTVFSLALAGFILVTANVRNFQLIRHTETMQLQLSQAENRALRAQINPHFLFNSLNTIRYFVRADQEKARQLLLDLSDVFQTALKAGDFVSLEDEIDFTKSYLALEQARLDDRLDVTWFIQSDDLYDVEVPTLILQPVVENAIVHGIAPQPEGGRIQVLITRGSEHLILQVIDDGVGIAPRRLKMVTDLNQTPDMRDGSIGTYNIQSRLETLYGSRGGCRIESTEGKGTTVEIRVPLSGLKGVAEERMPE